MKTLISQYRKSEQYLKDFHHAKKVPVSMVLKYLFGLNTVPGVFNAVL